MQIKEMESNPFKYNKRDFANSVPPYSFQFESLPDCLIRTHYYKYFHPKECYIEDASVNSCLNKEKTNIDVIYPFGCTMNVNKPAVVALISGSTTFPVDRPLAAMYYDQNTGEFY